MEQHSSVDELEALARVAHEEFSIQLKKCSLRVWQTSNKSFDASRYKKTFLQIASRCVNHGIPVREFVRINFHTTNKKIKYITPKDLLSKYALDKYKEYVKYFHSNDCAQLWATQMRRLKRLAPEVIPQVYKTVADILLDPEQTFSSWFRIFALTEPDERVIKVWGNDAIEEIKSDHMLYDFLYEKGFDLPKLYAYADATI